MSENRILKVGITQGDINGIGTEIIIKTLADNRICELFTPVIYGSSKVFAHYRKGIEGADGFSLNVITSPGDARHKRVNLIEASSKDDLKIAEGEATAEAGKAAAEFLLAAVEDLRKGNIDVLVAAPVNNGNVRSEGFDFTGHIQFFGSEFDGEPLMLMCGEALRVGLATTSMPLADALRSIGKELIIKRLEQLRESLHKDFSIFAPRIAVLSVNPHAGEQGFSGSEETDIIKPAIVEAFGKGTLAFGPFAADGFFASGEHKKYDAVLAMYYDQGIAPFKALCPCGVEFAAGLPTVCVGPDHGVGYDIAGKDKADECSLRQAIYTAIDIWRSRKTFSEITANPLKHYERERGADVSVSELHLAEQED